MMIKVGMVDNKEDVEVMVDRVNRENVIITITVRKKVGMVVNKEDMEVVGKEEDMINNKVMEEDNKVDMVIKEDMVDSREDAEVMVVTSVNITTIITKKEVDMMVRGDMAEAEADKDMINNKDMVLVDKAVEEDMTTKDTEVDDKVVDTEEDNNNRETTIPILIKVNKASITKIPMDKVQEEPNTLPAETIKVPAMVPHSYPYHTTIIDMQLDKEEDLREAVPLNHGKVISLVQQMLPNNTLMETMIHLFSKTPSITCKTNNMEAE